MKNILISLTIILFISFSAQGQSLSETPAFPIRYTISKSDSSYNCANQSYRAIRFIRNDDSITFDTYFVQGCEPDIRNDSLTAHLVKDTLWIKRSNPKTDKEWLKDSTWEFCCYKIICTIPVSDSKLPVIFLNEWPINLTYELDLTQDYSWLYENHKDDLNHKEDSTGYIGSFFIDLNAVQKELGLEDLPIKLSNQFILRPHLATMDDEIIPPYHLAIITKGDTTSEVLYGRGLDTLGLKILYNGRIIETQFKKRHWFKTIPGKGGRVKSVIVVFPDGHLEEWP